MDRYLADRACHAHDRETHHALGHDVHIEAAEGCCERLNGSPRLLRMERDFSGQGRRGVQAIEHEVGIRHRGCLAAEAIAGRPWARAGALRTDPQHLAYAHARDAAAPGADGNDVQLRHPGGVPGDPGLCRMPDLAGFHQADIGARAAHVAGDEIADAGLSRDGHRAGDASGRARQHGGRRKAARGARGHDSAA